MYLGRHFLLLVAVLLLSGLSAAAEIGAIRITGRKEITVTTSGVRLGDLAEIASPKSQDDEAVIGLKKIWIEESPAPGQMKTLSAGEVLDKVRSQGVDLTQVGYVFPRAMTVRRASRELAAEEVKNAITSALAKVGSEIELKGVAPFSPIAIAPGSVELVASPVGGSTGGRARFSLQPIVDGEPGERFTVEALIDEFREVPVARRSIGRGAAVLPDDIAMARLNTQLIPRGAAMSDHEIIGKTLSHDLPEGSVFRTGTLEVPKVISSGERVTLLYRSGALEATASGIALSDGGVGEEIQVRNESSKKTLLGRVLEPGIVGVK